jgi:8-amino-7-oxononanoate synthase
MPTARTTALDTILHELARIDDAGLLRRTRVFAPNRPDVEHAAQVEDRGVHALCSNDYLGLAADPRLTDAAERVAREDGFGAGAARLISGTRAAHELLERSVAAHFGVESALSFSSGFAANLSVLGALLGADDLVVSDARNHASIVDGIRLTRATRRVAQHADLDAFRAALDDADGFRRVLVVTEGLFSMDGDVAPLGDLLDLTRSRGGLLVVDDAHGTGVLGATGRGALEACGVGAEPDVVRVGTFGKAFGAAGAFVAAVPPVIDLIVNQGRAFVYSTAVPPPLAAAARCGMELAANEPWRRTRCLALADRLRDRLAQARIAVLPSRGPIVSVVLGDPRRAVAVSETLLRDHGIYVPPVRPPTVPDGTSRLRFTTSATHDEALVDHAVLSLTEALA